MSLPIPDINADIKKAAEVLSDKAVWVSHRTGDQIATLTGVLSPPREEEDQMIGGFISGQSGMFVCSLDQIETLDRVPEIKDQLLISSTIHGLEETTTFITDIQLFAGCVKYTINIRS